MLFFKVLLFSLMGVIPVGIKSFGFPEGAHNRGLPSNLTIYTKSSSWMKICFWYGWWWFISFAPRSLPFTLSHSILSFFFFLSLVTICFKNGTFSLHLSRASHVEKQSGRFYSLNLCGTQKAKQLPTRLVQIIFNAFLNILSMWALSWVV